MISSLFSRLLDSAWFVHHYAYKLAVTEGEVELKADQIIDANGHILPYVRFHGGQLRLLPDAIRVLDKVAGDAR